MKHETMDLLDEPGYLAKSIRKRYPSAKHVLVIGSDDGELVDALIIARFKAMCVDPETSHPYGIRGAFTDQFSRGFQMKFDLVVIGNIFAHSDDAQDFIKGVRRILKPGGCVITDLFIRDVFDAEFSDQDAA